MSSIELGDIQFDIDVSSEPASPPQFDEYGDAVRVYTARVRVAGVRVFKRQYISSYQLAQTSDSYADGKNDAYHNVKRDFAHALKQLLENT